MDTLSPLVAMHLLDRSCMIVGKKFEILRSPTIPFASGINFIKYAMLCTRPIVYLAMSLARGYNGDPGVDHWTSVKIILSYLRGLRKCLSVMEVIKNSS